LAILYRRHDTRLDITGSLDKSTFVDIDLAMAGTSSTGLTRSATVFHALSDETRLDILARLRDGEQCVCELTDILKAAQSRLSFHLKVLKDAGLIRDRAEGRWMYYALNEGALEEVEDLIRTFKKAAKAARSANRCC
jgi:ArsR family transcriptional regulator